MRIVHAVATISPAYGGPAVSTLETCKALVRRGHHVELWATSWLVGLDGEPQSAGVRTVDGVIVRTFDLHAPHGWRRAPDLRRFAREHIRNFDVAEIHGLYHYHSFAVARECSRFGIPYVLRPYGSFNSYHRTHHAFRKRIYEAVIDNPSVRRASYVRCTSHEEATAAREVGWRHLAVIPLGVTIDEELIRDRRNDEELRLLYLGRVSRKKNVPLLLTAVADFLETGRRGRMVIAGPVDDDMRPEISAIVRERGLDPYVEFSGLLVGDRKAEALRWANAYALPSEDENFSLATLEAAAAGLAVITSPQVAVGQVLADAGVSLSVAKDAHSLTSSLIKLADDPACRVALGESAARFAAEHYSWDAVAADLESLYRKA